MPRVGFKIKQMPRLDLPRFTRPEKVSIGTAVADAERARIEQALTPELSPAKPLTRRYAIQKSRKKGRNKRDWKYSGAMLNSLRVTATATGAVIKFAPDQVKKAYILEARDGLFNLSKRGEDAGTRQAALHFDKAVKRANK